MAYDFPASPSDGDIYEQFKWSADKSQWRLNNPEVVTPVPTYEIDYLAVGGGGAGGSGNQSGGGGGGAGGYLEDTIYLTESNSSFNVIIGAGGAGSGTATGLPGAASGFGVVRAAGGGGGAGNGYDGFHYGGQGGSSGGHKHWNASVNITGAPSVDSVQGNAGGALQASGGERWGSSGGGAGAAGGNANTSTVGPGGIGKQSSITGTATYYAGGGGGGPRYASTNPGGLGGGGTGAWGGTPTSGSANTGGGGGGASGSTAAGGNGGSGIVILKYPDTYSLTIGAGLTSSTTTSGGYKVTTFTAGTDTVSIA